MQNYPNSNDFFLWYKYFKNQVFTFRAMMMDANGIFKKQIAGGSCKMPKFALVYPISVMNVSNSHCYTSQSTI